MTARPLATLLLACLCGGCVGIAVHGDETHRAENPILSNDRARYFGSDGAPPRYPVPTKTHVLEAWGRPDRTEITQSGREKWVYATGVRWNGVVVFFGIPIPLLIPVGSDQLVVEFADHSVVAVETFNNEAKAGAACGLFAVHDLFFACGTLSDQGPPGAQFLGGTRHMLERRP